ncbi:DNA glycosylase AlkZ-like family protein [Engelhardtia mirabilis]|uniref:Winged helix DNA-binding domain-containing protein n=1 Tax=Engelhardtia mirabilis TaxID=2528011 RepID=A0A518BDA3_9BACT|nr:hypothetical protein Pla133_00190 [Planctomycetes bacterium Pla133]QDU99284.1 hypothetical protein Pla86_00190 [Planctomycetes bacterium Pla86]
MSEAASASIPRSVERRAAIAAQGLGGREGEELEELVARTGFVRTLGGADAYLALLARMPGLRRQAVDAALASGALRVVPAVRGCIYLVAERHVALALHLAESLSRGRNARELARAGVQTEELLEVQAAIVELLGARGALSTQGLRKALPAGVVRGLGEVGKKLGLASTLPPALRQLEFAGRVERTPETDRIDHERYLWRIPDANPLERGGRPADDADAHRRLAELFVRASGVCSTASFVEWSGLGKRAAQAALVAASATPVELEGQPGPAFADAGLLEDAARLAGAEGPVAFLPCADNLVALRGGPARMVEAAFHDIAVPVWGRGKGSTLGDVKHAFARTIVAGGRIVGLWEYDPDGGRLALGLFDHDAKFDPIEVERRAAGVAEFLRDCLGHGRAMVNETDEHLRGRAALVSRLAAAH